MFVPAVLNHLKMVTGKLSEGSETQNSHSEDTEEVSDALVPEPRAQGTPRTPEWIQHTDDSSDFDAEDAEAFAYDLQHLAERVREQMDMQTERLQAHREQVESRTEQLNASMEKLFNCKGFTDRFGDSVDRLKETVARCQEKSTACVEEMGTWEENADHLREKSESLRREVQQYQEKSAKLKVIVDRVLGNVTDHEESLSKFIDQLPCPEPTSELS